MATRRGFRSLLAALSVCHALGATASTTGSLGGFVRDSAGAARGGVVLELSGTHLQGSRRAISAFDGRYDFAYLPPGDGYALGAELDGGGAARLSGIRVQLGEEASLDVVLLPRLAEQVSVTIDRPLLDLRRPGRPTVVTAAQIDAFPTTRDFQRLAELAPGARFDRDDLNPAIGGATHLENDYVIEGISTRNPSYGGSGTKLTMNFVSEVQITTGEMSAEFGRVTGGVMNVLTKSGGNAFRGDVFAYCRNDDWASSNVRRSTRGTNAYDLGHDLEDWGVSVGGPIIRDRLWFFGSYGPRSDDWNEDIVNARFGIRRTEPFERESDVYAGKLDVALGSAQSATISAFGDPVSTTGWYALAQADPSNARLRIGSGGTNLSLRYAAIPRSDLTVDLVLGRHEQSSSSEAIHEEARGVPQQIEMHPAGGFAAIHGGPPQTGGIESTIDQLLASSSLSLGRHDLRFGAGLERSRDEITSTAHGFAFAKQVQINPVIGRRDRLREEFVDFSGYGSNETTSAYVQDRWYIVPALAFSLGLRWERQSLDSGRDASIATGAAPDGSVTKRAAGEFTFDDGWAPRLGLAWDPTGDGRAKVYASAGRYFATVPVGINVYAMNGYAYTVNSYYSDVAHTSADWWNPVGSPLDEGWIPYSSASSRDPEEPSPFDPDTELQHEDEISLGGEVTVGTAWTLGMRGVARELSRAIEDLGVQNPDDPTEQLGWIIANPGETSYGVPLPRPRRTYRALELTAARRFSDDWQLVASFVSARSEGNYDGYYHYASNGTGSGNFTPAYDDPRKETNGNGRLRADVPYELKVHSSYRFPAGITVSEAFIYSAGRPVSKRVEPGNYYITERGSEGRTPDHWTLDLHVGWELPFAKWAALTLVADIFNVTDNHEVLEVDEAYVYPGMPGWEEWYTDDNLDEYGVPVYDPSLPGSPYWGTPTLYQRGREIQLGVRLSY